jgi:hypothetical protein
MGKEGEGILVYYCIPQRDRVADVHAWPQGDLRQRRDQLRHGSRLSGATLVDSKHEVCTGVLIFNQSTAQVPNEWLRFVLGDYFLNREA